MRKMCLDYGDVRIGIALSDMLGIIASGLETYTRKDEDADIEHILKLIQDNSVDTVVIGLPINMDGTSGTRAEVTKAFDPVLGSHISSFLPMLEVMLVSLLIQCERGLHVA